MATKKNDSDNTKSQTIRSRLSSIVGKTGKKEQKRVESKQLVTFEVDNEEYASLITDLREIITMKDIVRIPNAPSFVGGILNLRGQIIVIIDLEKRFHLTRDQLSSVKQKHIIIAEVENSIFGIIVDEVTGVIRVPITSIKSTPSLLTTKIQTEYIRGVVILDDEGAENEVVTGRSKDENEDIEKKISKKVATSDKVSRLKTQKAKTKTLNQRLILLLNIPKMLAEKELLDIGMDIKQTIESIKQK